MAAPYLRVVGSLVVLLVVSSVVSAEAQDDPAAVENPSPRVEIGTIVSGLTAVGLYGIGIRASAATDQRFSFEVGLDWTELGRKERFVDQIVWLYFWQVRQALMTDRESRPRLFVTYGTAGWVQWSRQGFDASAPLKTETILPLAPLLGFGGQHVIARYVAVRADAQLFVPFTEIGLTPRFSAGISIPIGAYRR